MCIYIYVYIYNHTWSFVYMIDRTLPNVSTSLEKSRSSARKMATMSLTYNWSMGSHACSAIKARVASVAHTIRLFATGGRGLWVRCTRWAFLFASHGKGICFTRLAIFDRQWRQQWRKLSPVEKKKRLTKNDPAIQDIPNHSYEKATWLATHSILDLQHTTHLTCNTLHTWLATHYTLDLQHTTHFTCNTLHTWLATHYTIACIVIWGGYN